MTIDHRWPLAARHFPLGEIRRVLSGTPRRANWFVAGVIIRSHPLTRLRLPAARRESRHDGALFLQLQAADGRYVARTIPSPQLSAPPETEWLIRSIRRELAVPGMEMAMAAR